MRAIVLRLNPGLKLPRLDRVVLAIVAIAVALAVLDPPQLQRSLVFVGSSIRNTFPFLLLSVIIAGWLKASGADNLIAKAFVGRVAPMIVFAALMGALSPFCSCGVIPVIAALLSIGVPLPPVMAFWLASPLMDPSMFLITAATLGTTFAVAKTLVAIGMGLLGGFGTLALMRAGYVTQALADGAWNGGCAASRIRNPKDVQWKFWREEGRRHAFLTSARANLLFLGKWLLFAFVIESLMVAYMPSGLILEWLGGRGLLPIILGTLVGIPAYLNGYAALPLIAGLLDQGMAPGAAMAFLVGGGVTSVPASMAVYAVTTRPVFFAYLGFAVAGSMLAGFAYGWFMA